jgi:hypothetical protein
LSGDASNASRRETLACALDNERITVVFSPNGVR